MTQLIPVAATNDPRNVGSNFSNLAGAIHGGVGVASAPSGADFTPYQRGIVFDFGADVNIESMTIGLNASGNWGMTGPPPWTFEWATAAAPTTWTAVVPAMTGALLIRNYDFPSTLTARYIAVVNHDPGGFHEWLEVNGAYADGDVVPTPPPPEPLPAIHVEIDGVEFVGLREQTIRVALNDAGSFFFAINRADSQATEANIYRGAIVQVTIPQIHDDVLWEGILETGDFDLLKTGEEGEEWLHFGGPGTMAILKRAVMDFTQYEGANVEVFPSKGYWEFSNSAGNRTEGDIIRRIVDEAEAAARPGTPVPEISRTFTDDEDTDGTLWEDEAFEGNWRIPIGANVYDEVIRLANGGFVMVDFAPGLVMNAYRDFGRDLTSTTFATDKIRFVKGVNIVEDLQRSMLGASWATRAIVKKSDGEYVRAAISGTFEYEQEAYIESNAENTNTARREAQGQMRLREDAQEALLVSIIQPLTFQERDWTLGSDGTVKYLPGPEWSDRGQYWVGDLITLHTGTGDFEYDNFTQRIHAITLAVDEKTGELSPPIVELNAPYRRPGQDGDLTPLGGPSASTGSGGGGSGSGSGAHVHTAYTTIGTFNGHISDTDDAHDASSISVLDTAGHFTGTNVEAVLAELAAGINEHVEVVSASGSTETINYDTASFWDITLTDDCTFTITNPPADQTWGQLVIILRQGTGAPHLVTWPASVQWQDPDTGLAGGSAPTLWTTENAIDVMTLVTVDGGVTWGGSHGAVGGGVDELSDLTDVTITSPQDADRLRFNGSTWANSDLHWEPMVLYDGTVMLDSAGNPHMHEVSH